MGVIIFAHSLKVVEKDAETQRKLAVIEAEKVPLDVLLNGSGT